MRCWTCNKIVMIPDNKPEGHEAEAGASGTCSNCGSVYTVVTKLVGVRRKKDKAEGEE